MYEDLGNGKEEVIDPKFTLVVLDNKVVMPLTGDGGTTLYDVLEEAKKHNFKKGTILVLFELATIGWVYRYSNGYWEKIGETIGYT